MKKPSRLDYAYAVGRVRVLEKDLVERAVFSEAAEEKDFASSLKIIFDAGKFSEESVIVKDTKELDDFLQNEEEQLLRLLEKILLEKDIMELFLEDKKPDEALKITKRVKYTFFNDYIKHKIDLANLKIVLRLKYLSAPKERFEQLILKGGFLDEKILLQNYEESFAELGEKIQASPYSELWNKAINTLEEKETFIDLERGIEDWLMKYLRKAKYIVFGPEPVFAYGLAKRQELRLLRLLGVGKLNAIPAELLKQRISETYV